VIFQPLVKEGFEWINACAESDYEIFLSFDGSSRASTWKPVKVRRVRADERQAAKASDFPWLGAHALVMRRQVIDTIGDLLSKYGEILPLSTEDGTELFVLNVTNVLDALDEKRSELTRFRESNRIMRIKKPVFKPAMIANAEIFRLPYRASPTYVSQIFVDRVNGVGLEGLEFLSAWSERD
jgi:hypothetical protein